MRLSWSIAARDRRFAKAMRRVRAHLEPLSRSFNLVSLVDPLFADILVAITDDFPYGHWEQVPNRDGFFQVIAGFNDSQLSFDLGQDRELVERTITILEKSALACGLSNPDQEVIARLFASHRAKVLGTVA